MSLYRHHWSSSIDHVCASRTNPALYLHVRTSESMRPVPARPHRSARREILRRIQALVSDNVHARLYRAHRGRPSRHERDLSRGGQERPKRRVRVHECRICGPATGGRTRGPCPTAWEFCPRETTALRGRFRSSLTDASMVHGIVDASPHKSPLIHTLDIYSGIS